MSLYGTSREESRGTGFSTAVASAFVLIWLASLAMQIRRLPEFYLAISTSLLLPDTLVTATANALLAAEAVTILLLLIPATRVTGLWATAVLLLYTLGVSAWRLSAYRVEPCQCTGQLLGLTPAGSLLLAVALLLWTWLALRAWYARNTPAGGTVR